MSYVADPKDRNADEFGEILSESILNAGWRQLTLLLPKHSLVPFPLRIATEKRQLFCPFATREERLAFFCFPALWRIKHALDASDASLGLRRCPIAHADIFPCDNGQLIPGTEGITPGPGMQLDHRQLEYASLANRNLSAANVE